MAVCRAIFLALPCMFAKVAAGNCAWNTLNCSQCQNGYIGGPFETKLPLVIIGVQAAIPSAISGKPSIAGSMKIIDHSPAKNSVSQPANVYDGMVSISRRGHSSDKMYCKKQYNVHLRSVSGDKMKKAILGMPKDSSWIVQGPYSDKSLQRQALVLRLSNALGLYAPRTRFVELFLVAGNATELDYAKHYQGVYVLIEKISVSGDRVNITKMVKGDKHDKMSGGYIVKVDKANPDLRIAESTQAHVLFIMDYPDKPSDHQVRWIGGYISCFEEALFGDAFTDPVVGYRAFIDIPSFVDYFLLTELSNNADSYRYSTYLNKDRFGLLRMGPLWDYDLAFGNVADWFNAESQCPPIDPIRPCEQVFKYSSNVRRGFADISAYYARLFADPWFKEQVVSRWRALREIGGPLSNASLSAAITEHAKLLTEAATRNFQTWRDPGISQYIWPEDFSRDMSCCFPTFQAHTHFLSMYVLGRAAWMDKALQGAMTTINVPPRKFPCCADPDFATCTGPSGQKCSLAPGDAQQGLGQYWDHDCKPGVQNTDGCVNLTAVGACHRCHTLTWRPRGPGPAYPPCPLCHEKTPCFAFNNNPPPSMLSTALYESDSGRPPAVHMVTLLGALLGAGTLLTILARRERSHEQSCEGAPSQAEYAKL